MIRSKSAVKEFGERNLINALIEHNNNNKQNGTLDQRVQNRLADASQLDILLGPTLLAFCPLKNRDIILRIAGIKLANSFTETYLTVLYSLTILSQFKHVFPPITLSLIAVPYTFQSQLPLRSSKNQSQ